MNKAILIGNLTRDPEINTTPSGVSVCKFSIATTRKFAKDGQEATADYHNIVTWRILADNCAKFLKKGNKVAAIGSIQTRSYDDKEGVKRYITEIVADEVEFLNAKKSDDNQPQQTQIQHDMVPVDDKNLPF